MRPRISNFGKMYFKDLHKYLTDNYVFGFTVKRGDPLKYTFLIMFRNSRKSPEELIIEVSSASKIVLGAYTKNQKFTSIQELLNYTKK